MPLYTWECSHCDFRFDDVCRIEDRDIPRRCNQCGRIFKRVISAPVVHDFEEYLEENLADQGSGEPFLVKSREHLKQRMKDLGLEQKPISYEGRARRFKGTVYSIGGI